MQTLYTDDQNQFRSVVSRFLEAHATTSQARELQETASGFDQAVWHQMSGELGLVGTHLPEAYGGFGFGMIELGIVLEEMGRRLYCGPFFSSAVLSGLAVAELADEANKIELLPKIASGEERVALVLDDLNQVEGIGHQLMISDQGLLSGTAPMVIDGLSAQRLLVIAGSATGLGLYQVDKGAQGLSITPRVSVDQTRKLAEVVFVDTATQFVGRVSPEALNRFWDLASVALSHEMIGGAERLLEDTIAYTKLRVQFGRPIGSVQAIKHRCADLLLTLEFAKAATQHVSFSLAAGEEEKHHPSMVKAMVSDCYRDIAIAAIQLRGGIGFTWENDTHLWFRRAKCSEVLLGTAGYHRERMIQSLGGQDAA
ncbi:MAG: hypothetical protein CBC55_06760 [Gammaproteobacteria bacterium TMED95]|nr:acyl-CoA dehydrogenase [Gammaproteobacteria bacterium]OUV21084.1 MAG: hypothetical protein CBC55_06760 [Gammaproteobacteria bacterium TMED95]